MYWDTNQLRALAAAVSEGTLDGAARLLHVTPSALSQRIKALEESAGRVLLVRSKPVRPTGSGLVLLRLAREFDLLSSDAAHELGGRTGAASDDGGPPRMDSLSVAVNADSLATWVLPALVPLATEFRLDLHREDQDHTSALLRDGTVMAAVTTQAQPLPGCSSTLLGGMRYRPMARPDFFARWFPGGVSAAALHAAPVVVFDRKDDLQHAYLRRRTHGRADPPSHHVPSSADFCMAVQLGVGWGMLPDLQSREAEAAGALVDIDPGHGIDVVLYWQQWRLRSATLDRLAAAVADAAGAHLIQPSRGRAAG